MSLLALKGERERSISVATNGGVQEAFNSRDSSPHTRARAHTHTQSHTDIAHTHRQGAREKASHSNGRRAIKRDNRERIRRDEEEETMENRR